MQGTHQDMHREHRQWVNDAALWQEEVELWRGEYAQALADLQRLEAGLRKHSECLVEHAAAVKFHVGRVEMHEHALAEFEEVGAGDDLLLLAKKHRAEAEQHGNQRNMHDQTKHQHHALMAEWAHVVKHIAK